MVQTLRRGAFIMSKTPRWGFLHHDHSVMMTEEQFLRFHSWSDLQFLAIIAT